MHVTYGLILNEGLNIKSFIKFTKKIRTT